MALHEERDAGEGRALMENGRRGQIPLADRTAREEARLNRRAERS